MMEKSQVLRSCEHWDSLSLVIRQSRVDRTTSIGRLLETGLSKEPVLGSVGHRECRSVVDSTAL